MFNMSHTYFETCRHILSPTVEIVLIVIAGTVDTRTIRIVIMTATTPSFFFGSIRIEIVRRPEGPKGESRLCSLHHNVNNNINK
jgi:hypothetical protein